MPTVIDSLVVTLGLDASKFTEQQKKAVDSLRQFQDAADKHTKPVQKGMDDLVGTFKEFQGRLLAIGALIATGLGFNRLVQDVTKLNTELGFTSKTLGMTAQQLSEWEQVGRTVGAASGEITQNLKSLNAEIHEFHATGNSKLAQFMGQVGMKNLRPDDTPDAVAKRINSWYQGQPNKPYAQHLMASRGSLSQGMINLLTLSPEELQKRLDQAKRFAPTDEEINKFTKLTEAFGEMLNVIDRLATEAILPFVETLTKILNLLTDWLGKWAENGQTPAEAAGEGFGKLGMPELKPNQSKPGLFQRGWNWLLGRPSGGGAETGGGGPAGAGSSAPAGSGGSGGGANDNAPAAAPAASSAGSARSGGSSSPPGGSPDSAQAGNNDFTGVGGYNFMGSERARAMGMDVKAFSADAQMKWPTGITNGNGPASIRANKYAGRDMAGFLKDLSDAGAPLDQFAGAYVPKKLQHGYGNALDIETGFGSGPDNSPKLYAWAQAHPKEFAAIQSKYHMRNLDTSSGASIHDWGHFEWTPTGIEEKKPGTNLGANPSTQRSFENWRNLGLGARGAALGPQSSIRNSNSNSTHIESMNVSSAAGAGHSGSGDIQRRLGDYDNVQNSNTGMV